MRNPAFRTALLYAGLVGVFILADLALDLLMGGTPELNLPHLILAAIVLLTSYILLKRGLEARDHAEAVLRQARDELETRVQARTVELARANAALQAEISERKRAEQEREQSLAQVEYARQRAEDLASELQLANSALHALIETLPAGVVVTDSDGGILLANPIANAIMGSALMGASYNPRQEPLYRPDGSPLPLEDIPLYRAIHYGESVAGIETVLRDESESKTCIWMAASPMRDASGRVISAVAIVQDITERKRLEQTLRESERLFHKLAQVSPVGIFRTDVHGDCVYVNQRWIEMAGLTQEQALGKGWAVAIHTEDRAAVSAEWYASVQEKRPFRLEYRFQRPDGDVTWVLGQALGETDDTGQIVGYVGAITDITERKRSEIELQRTQAELARRIQERTVMEERQRLARELHDSVSQSLYGISLGAHTALALFDTDRTQVLEALNYVLSLAQAGLTEMRALIFELRPESLEMEGLVAALNKQTAALYARHGIEIELALCDEPDMPLETKEALYRIAQEALQNAVKHARADRLDVRLIYSAESIRLEICDNGVGFDPMAAYPGHLGLRSMRERAMSVGGTLEIVSAPGSGTRIRACLPVSTAQPA